MTLYLKAAIKTWKQADAEAKAAEALLSAGWDLYVDLEGPPVSSELTQEVLDLRARANAALAEAMRLWEIYSERPEESDRTSSKGLSDS